MVCPLAAVLISYCPGDQLTRAVSGGAARHGDSRAGQSVGRRLLSGEELSAGTRRDLKDSAGVRQGMDVGDLMTE